MVKKLNEKLFREAKRYIPGGVNSPVRSFKAVGGNPVFVKKASGSKIYDVEGNFYIDYCMSWGALILGHAYPEIVMKVKDCIENGSTFGAPTQNEIELAKSICGGFSSIEMIRLVNSGTEACMSAIRLARAYTGRNKIIKFDGCYHGHADYLLVQAGSGATTFNIPASPGIPDEYIKHTFTLPYNNIDVVEKTAKRFYKDIACIIIEPIPANMGVILPKPGFLEGLREICDRYKMILIFDEVITGFRLTYGGVEKLYNVKPDLVCLGKIIGGGFPAGAFGGKKEIMKLLAPSGPVYQAGTFSGNPVSVRAGLATLRILQNSGNYKQLEKMAGILCNGILENAKKLGKHLLINRIGSMFTIFFTDRKKFYDYQAVLTSNTRKYKKFFHKMLDNGIYLPPSQFEACFVSVAHTEKDIEKTIKASYEALKEM